MAYSDDLLLLCPNRYAAEKMLKICEEWSKETGITFSTNDDPAKSKTKVMVINKPQRQLCEPITLYGKKLPFVKKIDHLGHVLTDSGDHAEEANGKRGALIRKIMETRENFYFAHPREQIKAIKVFAGDLYGSNTWELGGNDVRKIYNVWRTAVKDC